MTIFKVRMLYTLYALFAVVFFLFFLFPSESIKKVAGDRFQQTYPPFQLQMDALKLTLPPGIQMTGLTLMEKNEALVKVTQLKLFPRLTRLIRGQLSVQFHGNAYEGTFTGDMDCQKDSWNQAEKLTLNADRLKIKKVAFKAMDGAPVVSGALGGSLTYSQAEKTGTTLEATFSLIDATLGLPAFSAQMGDIEFSKVEIAFSLERQTLNFRQFVFSGPQLEGAVSGTVRLLDPVSKSNLNLRLDISIRPEYQDKLSQVIPLVLSPNANNTQNSSYKLRIFGTLETPSFSITR
jgi:type II secretion system protein N